MSTNRIISPEHAATLAASAISPEVAEKRGYRTITTMADLKKLGFGDAQRLTPTLLMPIWGVNGEIAGYHHRPDTPRMSDGKSNKYEFPYRQRMAIDVHPALREQVRRPDVPLFITEGVKKADAAISKGLCCIAVIGTWNWRGTNEWGGKTALPDWDSIAFKNTRDDPRQVYIVYDSDVMLKVAVNQALTRLGNFLEHRGANVAYIYLPHGANSQKTGLDDYLAAGHTTDDLLALATSDLREPPQTTKDKTELYRETSEGLIWRKPSRDGYIDTPLSNFTARIMADIVEDDGAETRRHFEILAERNGRKSRVLIPAQAFPMMNWPMEHLGAGALLHAGMGVKDHARAAIQQFSGDPPTEQVYAHTGWRQISDENEGGEWAYLHSAGAIGAERSVQVKLPTALERFSLPDPPTGERLVKVLRSSLKLWDLLPDTISIPLFCAIYRSVLEKSDFSLHLAGSSGVFKSELGALAQQHFGAGLDARHLPGSWSSTDNALEGLAFAAKDCLLVLDDFAPNGTTVDVQRLHSKADRILRGQGNNAGRLRMRADSSLKPPKYPRGLILSTGEDIPLGLSLRARLLVLEIEKDMINPACLTEYQKEASSGLYAEAMAGFTSYLAPQFAQVRAGLRDLTISLRNGATGSQHRRTPEIVASLAVGLHWFLQCALEANAVTNEERGNLWKRGWNALILAAKAQSGHQAASEPTRRYLELLSAALASGNAHLAALDGNAPRDSNAWGWRTVTAGAGEYEQRPQGVRIGWIDGDDVYLQPVAAYNIAKKMGVDSGDGLTLASRTLHKRLHERGLLASVEEIRGTNTVRRTLDSQRRDVLHLHTDRFDSERLMAGKSDQTDQTDQTDIDIHFSEGGQGTDGQLNGQFPNGVISLTDQKTDQTTGLYRETSDPIGQNGQFGQFSETQESNLEVWRP